MSGEEPSAPTPDPDAVAAAVLSCPLVARLSGGAGGEVATYLPRRRVVGVRVRPGGAEVHVVAPFGPPVSEVAAAVRAAVVAAVGPLAVDVAVDDLDIPTGVGRP